MNAEPFITKRLCFHTWMAFIHNNFHFNSLFVLLWGGSERMLKDADVAV